MNKDAYQAALGWLENHPEQAELLRSDVRRLTALAAVRIDLPVRVPRLAFNLRGAGAGAASAHLVRLNPVLLRENFPDMRHTTVPHEVAHSVVAQIWPVAAPHGDRWRRIMAIFGADAERCHRYDTTNARVRRRLRYEFVCGCRRHFLGPVQRNRLLRGRTAYRCRRCNGTLIDADRSVCLDGLSLPRR